MNQENLLTRVNQGLDEIRPYLATDGGDLTLIKITYKYVYCLPYVYYLPNSGCYISFQ